MFCNLYCFGNTVPVIGLQDRALVLGDVVQGTHSIHIKQGRLSLRYNTGEGNKRLAAGLPLDCKQYLTIIVCVDREQATNVLHRLWTTVGSLSEGMGLGNWFHFRAACLLRCLKEHYTFFGNRLII